MLHLRNLSLSVAVVMSIFAFCVAADEAETQEKSSGRELMQQFRTLFSIDGGSTDNIGLADILLTIGGVVALVLGVVVLIALLMGTGSEPATGYEATGATAHADSTYLTYEPAFDVVARALVVGYKKYELSQQ